jgi:hypothetical protein
MKSILLFVALLFSVMKTGGPEMLRMISLEIVSLAE